LVAGSSTGVRWDAVVEQVLARRDIQVCYQPIVSLADGSVVACEALARPPGFRPRDSVDELFAAGHRLGRTPDLDWLCRRVALARVPWASVRWSLFLNVSSSTLLDPIHDVDQMLMLVRWGGGRPHRVVIEITEHEFISDLRRLGDVLEEYRDQGFRFAVDDVGEAYATLEVVAAARPEYLKIPRRLVAGLADPETHAAMATLVAFARARGAVPIAEGIEDETTARMVRDLGIDLGQGHLFAAPVPSRRLAWSVARRPRREAAEGLPC